MIDSHVHVWTRSLRNAAWLDRGPAATNRDFTSHDLIVHLDQQAASASIVVQSQDSLDETRELLELAEREPRVLGVVGYLPLHDPVRLARLHDVLDHPALVGARSIQTPLSMQSHASEHSLDPAVSESLAILAMHRLALDVVGRPPAALDDAVAAATTHPGLHVIADHLANRHLESRIAGRARATALPPVLACLPNLFVKLSGLSAVADDEFAVHVAAFASAIGPRRLLFGSDWPICLRHGDTNAPLRRAVAATRDLADADADAWIFAETARIAYPRLGGRDAIEADMPGRNGQRENENQR
ncbi:amidohydrolase family protein [Microbacterium sp. ZW CA_36]|uniref:amidohydrolase family protein n=1 Tax=Microbacterium sp. ZW CA_36 TaxID=3378078 RepID=UPI003851DC9B